MEVGKPRFKKYLLVCQNERVEGTCCMPLGQKIRESLKQRVKTKGLDDQIRVSRTGCLDLCAEGPNVLLMPDNKWFKRVRMGDDLDKILGEAAKDL